MQNPPCLLCLVLHSIHSPTVFPCGFLTPVKQVLSPGNKQFLLELSSSKAVSSQTVSSSKAVGRNMCNALLMWDKGCALRYLGRHLKISMAKLSKQRGAKVLQILRFRTFHVPEKVSKHVTYLKKPLHAVSASLTTVNLGNFRFKDLLKLV